ncbi:unnamed protein product, partial [Prunus brigantina]
GGLRKRHVSQNSRARKPHQEPCQGIQLTPKIQHEVELEQVHVWSLIGQFLGYLCRSFFKSLKKGHKDKWDDECEVVFQNFKTYLTSPPLLSKPILVEDLYIYLAVSDSAVSSALIREELGAQHSVFYTSKALLDAETRYPKIEKLIFSL